MKLTLNEIKKIPEVKMLLTKSDKYMGKVGITEHGFKHAEIVSKRAQDILLKLNYSKQGAELAAIAGYLHDIGNIVSRHQHAQSSALIVYSIFHRDIGVEELIRITTAIGNHHETQGDPVNALGAAVIIADKSDVRRSRVRNVKTMDLDIHDRVNYATKSSKLSVNKKKKTIRLSLTTDKKIASVMEYFEIFLERMIACKRAASSLGCKFELFINRSRLI